MRLTFDHLAAIAGGTIDAGERANMMSILAGLDTYGAQAGLDRAHRLAQYIAQIAHESGRFRFDREVWGPTATQKRYEGRADLGNIRPGDGSKYRGYTPGQITGRHNTTAYRDWCGESGLNPPDFVEQPALMNTDPWEGLGPIWYWDVGNPEGRSLNRYADTGNIDMITLRINGGTNGLADRLDLYIRSALVLLGYDLRPRVVAQFQQAHGLTADDIAGPVTRMALHRALVALADEVTEVPPVSVPAPAPAQSAGGPDVRAAIAKMRAAIADLERSQTAA
ncbi:glycoside hydrolase family 19 protein [Fulvimarina endophytica]|uniref:Glycoside hydrolase family 19 protein n=1 Tax=Fulvimarina endophytica TaxID=2293836 RepID=A0A371X310_9HYPH|nr:glycoside hydrolase family 19 protein [Fulvimarina endophytica]RFC63620.1 glycoside hydrolase family 19 protein [Fulvimarina endophytica]